MHMTILMALAFLAVGDNELTDQEKKDGWILLFDGKTPEGWTNLKPVNITVFSDKSFSFEMKTPPASYFLKKAAKLASGSKAPGRTFAGTVTKAQVREIAEAKMKDLNANDVDMAMRLIEGSARSMGIQVRG